MPESRQSKCPWCPGMLVNDGPDHDLVHLDPVCDSFARAKSEVGGMSDETLLRMQMALNAPKSGPERNN